MKCILKLQGDQFRAISTLKGINLAMHESKSVLPLFVMEVSGTDRVNFRKRLFRVYIEQANKQAIRRCGLDALHWLVCLTLSWQQLS